MSPLSRHEYYSKRCDVEFNLTYEEHCQKWKHLPQKEIKLWQIFDINSNIQSLSSQERVFLNQLFKEDSLQFLDVIAEKREENRDKRGFKLLI